ncbi:MAG TPA: hypothetical protein PLR73_10745 [Acetivibrio sp.]|nr:hypothetical protein [Acetivibrio sp.]
MTKFFDKCSVHQVLMQPVKLFGYPKTKDKVDALNLLRHCADLGDIRYIYPLVFEKNAELASTAAQIVSEVMEKVQGKQWNTIYYRIKYTAIDIDRLDTLLNFDTKVSVHLLGIASLNYSGYIREKALKLVAGLSDPRMVPYILLRLNDWVLPVRNLAADILKNTLVSENIDTFIENFCLIDKLHNVSRVDLKGVRNGIVEYLKNDNVIDKIKTRLRHENVKKRLFCYSLLEDKIAEDIDIINSALKDKSFEIRMWLVNAIKKLDENSRDDIIEKLLQDKSAKVRTAVLRNYEDIVLLKFRERLLNLLSDDNASVREDARFICKKHSIIKDFPEFYRQQILINPVPGALVGLGETGDRNDYDLACKFFTHGDSKVKIPAMISMWYLSKDDAVKYVIDSLESDIPKIRKTAKKLLKKSKMPQILFEMRNRLEGDNTEIKLFALEVICNYRGWHALEGILFAIANDEGIVLEKAKNLLGRCLTGLANIYTKPDKVTRDKIIGLYDDIRRKNVISDRTIREISFFIETKM